MSSFDITLDCLSDEALSFLRSKFNVYNKLELAQLMNAKIYGKDSTNLVFCTILLDGGQPQQITPKVIDTEPIVEEVQKSESVVKPTFQNIFSNATKDLIAPITNFELSYYGDSLFVTPRPREGYAVMIGCNWDEIDPNFEVNSTFGGWWKPTGSLKNKTLSGWMFRTASKDYLNFLFDKSDIKHYGLEHYGKGLLLEPPYNFTLSEKDGYKNWSQYDKKFSVDTENGGWWKPLGSLEDKTKHGWFFKVKNQEYLENMLGVKLQPKETSTPKKEAHQEDEKVEDEVPTTPEIKPSAFTPPAPKKELQPLAEDLKIEEVINKYGKIIPYGIGFIVSFTEEIFKTHAKKNVITLTNASGKEFNGIKHTEKNGYFFEEEAKESISIS